MVNDQPRSSAPPRIGIEPPKFEHKINTKFLTFTNRGTETIPDPQIVHPQHGVEHVL